MIQSLGSVLLVDSDATSNFVSERVLRRRKLAMSSSVVESGKEALELVQRQRFDLVLLETHNAHYGRDGVHGGTA